MHVQAISLDHFTRHERTEVALPERGVVFVAGPNGSGKSSLLECVSYTAFGRTLRGTEPWTGGTPGEVQVYLAHGDGGQLSIARTIVASGRKALLFGSPEIVDGTSYETSTKAQAALLALLDTDFDVWRRTHVFSSADADAFSTATDAERKRLLESILGLDRFDAALERCRVRLSVTRRDVVAAEQAAGIAAARVEDCARRVERARAVPVEPRPEPQTPAVIPAPAEPKLPAEPPAPTGAVGARDVEQAQATFNAAQREFAAVGEAAARAGAVAQEAARACASFDATSDRCPTCGQPPTEQMRATHARAREVLAEKRAEHKTALAACESVRGLRDVAQQRLDEARSLATEYDRRVRAREQWRETRDGLAAQHAANMRRWQDAVAHARDFAESATQGAFAAWAKRDKQRTDEIAASTAALADADRADEKTQLCLAEVRDDVAVETEVERVLGLKGVRAMVLGQALAGVEACGNKWLARLAGPGLRVKLTETTERASGGVREAIGLEVLGAGGGRGYRGASGGERRRIDLALTFALGEVSAAAHGATQGTVWVDECMDALDADGVEAACEVLEELARDRCVVVISHRDDLARRLRMVKRLRVENGRVTEEAR
jgi:DNA repair exonuclease SbcCD ATPase subunit